MGVKRVAVVLFLMVITVLQAGCILYDVIGYPIEGQWDGTLYKEAVEMNVTMHFEAWGKVTITEDTAGIPYDSPRTIATTWRPEGDHYIIALTGSKQYISVNDDKMTFPATVQADYIRAYNGTLTRM